MPSQPAADSASTQSSNIAIVGSPDGFTKRRPAGAAESAALMPACSATGSSMTTNGRVTPCRASTSGREATEPSPNVISTGRWTVKGASMRRA